MNIMEITHHRYPEDGDIYIHLNKQVIVTPCIKWHTQNTLEQNNKY